MPVREGKKSKFDRPLQLKVSKSDIYFFFSKFDYRFFFSFTFFALYYSVNLTHQNQKVLFKTICANNIWYFSTVVPTFVVCFLIDKFSNPCKTGIFYMQFDRNLLFFLGGGFFHKRHIRNRRY